MTKSSTTSAKYPIEQRCYTLVPSKICAPLNFAPLIFPPLIFVHPHISHPFNFRAPLYYCKFAVFSFIRGIFSPISIFALSYCANLLPLNFAQARCAKIKEAQILMGMRYVTGTAHKSLFGLGTVPGRNHFVLFAKLELS